jgi:hypothetical protein
MTIKEMAGLIGQRGTIVANGWLVSVKIVDVRQRYGTTDCQVKQTYDNHTAVTKWVLLDRVSLDESGNVYAG